MGKTKTNKKNITIADLGYGKYVIKSFSNCLFVTTEKKQYTIGDLIEKDAAQELCDNPDYTVRVSKNN